MGGDEYLLTLPNQTTEGALAFLRQLQSRIASAPYRGMHRVPTVFIGLCVVDVDLTNREVQERANRAKNFVKNQDNGRIGAFKGILFRDTDLMLV
jgi:GGDEF domain-containing protein